MATAESTLIVHLLADNADLKAKLTEAEGKITSLGAKVNNAGASMGQMGNMLLKGLGIGMLIKQLGDVVMGMEEIQRVMKRRKRISTIIQACYTSKKY